MKYALIALFVIALLALGGFALTNRDTSPAANGPTPTTEANNSTASNQTDEQATISGQEQDPESTAATPTPEQQGGAGNAGTTTATISYTSNGFAQSTVTVKSGSEITITNSASVTAQPASDPHPQHTDNPELNFGDIAAGQSKTITVTQAGTWGVHDHYQPSKKMTIIVQ
jgi:plastocyanin